MAERLEDLDALLEADGEVLDDGVGVDVEAELLGEPRGSRRSAVLWSSRLNDLVGSNPSTTFSATVKTGTSMKCWCTMPMPRRTASPELANCDGLAVDEDLALVGVQQAEEDVHQRRLAGAVLTEEAVDLAGLDDEVDLVVGGEGTESLRDPAEFDAHQSPYRSSATKARVLMARAFVRWRAVR